jgi:hypothetical protein
MVRKIVSGGQTGVDRTALDFAREQGLAHGGWCPRCRWAEDGRIPSAYKLTETPGRNPSQRTEWNVRDSDATVIFSTGKVLTGGTLLTRKLAIRYQRPWLHLVARQGIKSAAAKLLALLQNHRIQILNVAGPRASRDPQAARFAREVLAHAFSGTKRGRVVRRAPALQQGLGPKHRVLAAHRGARRRTDKKSAKPGSAPRPSRTTRTKVRVV